MDQQGIDVVSVCALRPITLCLFLSVSQMNTLIWSLPPFISVCLCSLCSSLGRLCWWLPLFRLSEPITRRIITPSLAELTLTIFNWSSHPPPLLSLLFTTCDSSFTFLGKDYSRKGDSRHFTKVHWQWQSLSRKTEQEKKKLTIMIIRASCMTVTFSLSVFSRGRFTKEKFVSTTTTTHYWVSKT